MLNPVPHYCPSYALHYWHLNMLFSQSELTLQVLFKFQDFRSFTLQEAVPKFPCKARRPRLLQLLGCGKNHLFAMLSPPVPRANIMSLQGIAHCFVHG